MRNKFIDISFGIFLLVISIYDIYTLTIPDIALLACFIVVILNNIISKGFKDSFVKTLIAFGNGFLLTLVLYLTSNQGDNIWLGGGDIKLVALISYFIEKANIVRFDILLAGAICLSFILRSLFDISYIPFGIFICAVYFLQKIDIIKTKVSVEKTH